LKLTLLRDTYTDKSTTGELSLNGVQSLWTLELPNKDGLPGSCIPQGTYNVISYPSPRFKRLMPLLVGIPGRSNIEIHWGNSPADTDGCILLGRTRDTDYIGQSRMAFDDFWAKAQDAIEAGNCWITIIGGAKVAVSNAEDVQNAMTGEN
jgi:hypothetical protein